MLVSSFLPHFNQNNDERSPQCYSTVQNRICVVDTKQDDDLKSGCSTCEGMRLSWTFVMNLNDSDLGSQLACEFLTEIFLI